MLSMLHYEVTATPAAELRGAYERYMRERHIADVLATGCFGSAHFAKLSDGRYRATYVAAEQADLDRYVELHAARLRGDFAEHFPSGIAIGREVWEVLQRWPE